MHGMCHALQVTIRAILYTDIHIVLGFIQSPTFIKCQLPHIRTFKTSNQAIAKYDLLIHIYYEITFLVSIFSLSVVMISPPFF